MQDPVAASVSAPLDDFDPAASLTTQDATLKDRGMSRTMRLGHLEGTLSGVPIRRDEEAAKQCQDSS